MYLRPNLALYSLDDDVVVFSEQSQCLIGVNSSAAIILSRLQAGQPVAEIANALIGEGIAAPADAMRWVTATVDLLRTRGLLLDAPPFSGQTADARGIHTSGLVEKLPPPPPFKVAVEQRYRLLGTRLLVRFGLPEQVGWVDAAIGHLAINDHSPPNLTIDLPGEDLGDGRRFATIYRDGECIQPRARLFRLGPAVKGALWQSAVNNHNFLFNFHAGVVGTHDSCILLPGSAGSGKSSLTAALTHRGFEYFSDEVALLEPKSFHVPRVPLALCVKSTGWDVIARYYPRILVHPVHVRADGKLVRYLRIVAKPDREQPKTAPVSHIIFPRYDEGALTELKPISRTETLRRLMDECMALSRHLDRDDAAALVHWIKGIDSYALSFSSLEAATELVAQIVQPH